MARRFARVFQSLRRFWTFLTSWAAASASSPAGSEGGSILRALLHRPKILILDEPTTGLDPQTRSTLWQVIAALRREENMTVFLTTHYMEEAAVQALGLPYEALRDAYRIRVANTEAATELILRRPELFRDYEIVKGKMDDVFLAVTGRKLTGGAAQ